MASRVHIIEPGWNPMLEQQALQRVHRLGQTQPVEQIRYVVDGEDSVERASAYLPILYPFILSRSWLTRYVYM